MKNLIVFFFIVLFLSALNIKAQIEDYYPGVIPQNEEPQLAPSATTMQDTVNMAVVLCVEKDQDKKVRISQFVNPMKLWVQDYFQRVTFNNFKINYVDVLVESNNPSIDSAYAFELPDHLVFLPGLDTNYCVRPWMVRNVLSRADTRYNFDQFDYNRDGVVDMLVFIVIRHAANNNGGTVGLSTNDFYTTTDSSATGGLVQIDGTGYLTDGRHAVIIKNKKEPMLDEKLSHIFHELGHAFFKLPDYDHMGYTLTADYAMGQFCIMSGGGFNHIASPINPIDRYSLGWITKQDITTTQTITLNDIEDSGQLYYYQARIGGNPPYGNWFLTFHKRTNGNRWVSQWPIPLTQSDLEYRGVLIWQNHDIEAAHGKWDWLITDVSTIMPPNDRRPVRSNIENPVTGKDSLEVRYSYEWLKYNTATGQYDMLESEYSDHRIGSETCFFDPANPKVYAFYTNPNSCNNYSTIGVLQKTNYSGLKLENLRIDNNVVKADIKVGEAAYTVDHDITLSKGKWILGTNLIINPGATLTIQSGSNLVFKKNASIIVNGTLRLEGIEDEEILIDYPPASNDAIIVNQSGNAILNHVTIRDAINSVKVYGGSVTASNIIFENSTKGFLFYNGSLSATNINYTGCSLNGIELNGSINIPNDLSVPGETIMEINSGTTLNFTNNASLIVDGTLTANGTSSNRITFNFVSPNSSVQNGIKVNSEGSIIINRTDIYSAYNGIFLNSGSVTALDVTFNYCTYGYKFAGNVNVQSDLTLPYGVVSAIINSGTTLNFLNNSLLIVNGQLNASTCVFDFQSPFISEQKINGIRIYSDSNFNVDVAEIKNAYCGIIYSECPMPEGSFLYTNCYFENMPAIGGGINTNITLQGNYLVEQDLTVSSGISLNINPPSYFLFLNGSALRNEGHLGINGGQFDFYQPNINTGNGIIGGYNSDVYNAQIFNAHYGLYGGYYVENCTIMGCDIGIFMLDINYNYLTNNDVSNNNYGVYMVSSETMMNQNHINNNISTGLTSSSSSFPVLMDEYLNSAQNEFIGNDCGISVTPYSDGLLGIVDLNNKFDLNNSLDIYIANTSITAQANYWRGIDPYTSPYVLDGGGSDFDYWLTSPPFSPVGSGNESLYKSTSVSANDANIESSKTNSDKSLSKANANSSSSNKIKDIIKLMRNNDYENVKKQSKEILDKEIDSKYALTALNLYKLASKKLNDKASLNAYLNELYNNKDLKPIYAVAGLMQSFDEEGDKKLSLIDNVINKYQGYDVVEMALFDKMLFYLFDKKDNEKAKEVVAVMDKLYPKGDYTKDAKNFFVPFKHDSTEKSYKQVKNLLPEKSILSKTDENEKPTEYVLSGNYPNPFNPTTTIKYALPAESNVELKIYDLMGREIRTLVNGNDGIGYKEIMWDGKNNNGVQVSSGIYLYRLVAKSLEDGKIFEKSAKMILMK